MPFLTKVKAKSLVSKLNRQIADERKPNVVLYHKSLDFGPSGASHSQEMQMDDVRFAIYEPPEDRLPYLIVLATNPPQKSYAWHDHEQRRRMP